MMQLTSLFKNVDESQDFTEHVDIAPGLEAETPTAVNRLQAMLQSDRTRMGVEFNSSVVDVPTPAEEAHGDRVPIAPDDAAGAVGVGSRAQEVAAAPAVAEDAQEGSELDTVHAFRVDLMRVQAEMREEMEEQLTAAVERARAEAAVRHEAELAEAVVKAERLRDEAVAEAQAAAELRRSQEESNERHAEELKRVRAEADQVLVAQLATANQAAEEAAREAREAAATAAEQKLESEIASARADAEGMLANELARVRAETEEQLTAAVERARAEAAVRHEAERAEAVVKAERLREEAVAEAQAAAVSKLVRSQQEGDKRHAEDLRRVCAAGLNALRDLTAHMSTVCEPVSS